MISQSSFLFSFHFRHSDKGVAGIWIWIRTNRLLAELMIPDGAHANAEDWTYFFLNQAPANTIAPVFSDAQSTDSGSANSSDQPLLYVINLVKTKKDPAAPRSVLSMPIELL